MKTKYELIIDSKTKPTSNKPQIIIFAVVLIVAIVTAFLVGYFARDAINNPCKSHFAIGDGRITKSQKIIYKSIVDSVDTEELKKNLHFFAGKPHAASTKRNNELLQEIYNRFQSYNYKAEKFEYTTLLSIPNLLKRNYVYVMNTTDGKELFKSKGIEDILESSENDTSAFPPFHAYSPNGTVQGDLIYVNYGRFEDYEELETKYNVNVSQKIVLVRYGKIFRGDKVLNAQSRGAIAVIIYSDPYDYSPVPLNETFPNGRWLPHDGVQRGSVGKTEGDPLTQNYPAKEWSYHKHPSEVKEIPLIPSQPISAHDAYQLFSRMGGAKVENEWKGRFKLDYSIGPFKNTKEQVKVEVNNKLEIRTITNVCGTLKGKVEPDRYVLLGNHVDAWVNGAVDPSSGTAVMMEMAKVLAMKMKNSDWVPYRTIKFCGWDGEEYALIGSVEYVEEFRSQLRDRAVAYINLDSAVAGNESIVFSSSPLFHELLFKITKDVQDPIDSMTMFSKLQKILPDRTNNTERFNVFPLGSGSDFFAFYQFIGVPSIDIGYGQTLLNRKLGISSYPMYHSLHDTVYWMEHFVDKEYKVHKAVAQLSLYMLLYLSDMPLLPLATTQYGSLLLDQVDSLKDILQKKGGDKHGVTTEHLVSAARNFSQAAKVADKELNTVKTLSQLQQRMVNDRLVQVEKGFIYPLGLPGRPDVKHYVMAPSLHNSYGSSGLPAVTDLLYDIEKTNNWNEVKKQLSITTSLIQEVAENLKSP